MSRDGIGSCDKVLCFKKYGYPRLDTENPIGNTSEDTLSDVFGPSLCLLRVNSELDMSSQLPDSVVLIIKA